MWQSPVENSFWFLLEPVIGYLLPLLTQNQVGGVDVKFKVFIRQREPKMILLEHSFLLEIPGLGDII